MNRYPLWKYITVLVAVVIGLLYTLPNFYGESPAVQVSSAKATIKVDQATLEQVQQIIENAQLPVDSVYYEQNGTLGTVRARFPSTDVQLQARDLIDRTLNTVAGDPTTPWRSTCCPPRRPGCGRWAGSSPSPCTWAWTCAAACTSCCRSTCRAP